LPFKCALSLYQRLLVPLCVVAERVFLGIRFEVKGAENVPDQPCVILANHQSTWETFFLSAYFQPLSQVLKRELLFVPFFGWAMAMLRPIAIDRDNPKAALKHMWPRRVTSCSRTTSGC
jgi:1-acyl-sn-glycerol-3-phosphate acyltransferase